MMLRLLPKELSPDYQEKIKNIISPLLEHDNYEILSSTFTDYCKYNMNLSETSRNMSFIETHLYIDLNELGRSLRLIQEIRALYAIVYRYPVL